MTDLIARDRASTWHPFTQAATAPAPLPVVSANGVWLELEDGRRVLDAISSWWTNIHGHSHPTLVEFVSRQIATLDHVLFAGCTHPPAVAVAECIIEATPNGLERVFFSDNGSTAVEVALKMAFQYWQNRGRPEKKGFIALEHSYHGDTVGAMSAGDPEEFGPIFKELLFPVERVSAPTVDGDSGDLEQRLAELRELLERRGHQIGAMILEPMVQGAGGMRISPPAYLKGVAALCRKHDVLLIADEVMTGFGRTGKMFAVEHADVCPDIMCLAKGLTGGILPLSATVTTREIYDAFWDEDVRRAFLHGHSFTANPIACAAALGSFEIFRTEPVFDRIKAIESVYAERLPRFLERPDVKSVRWLGTIGVVEIATDSDGYFNQLGPILRAKFIERGFLVRPLGPVVYTLPPYVIQPEELHSVFDELETLLDTPVAQASM